MDLVKIDIEGSEFSLFAETSWLRETKIVTMEVHPDFGDPRLIATKLQGAGFEVLAADENVALVEDARHASFLYAWKP